MPSTLGTNRLTTGGCAKRCPWPKDDPLYIAYHDEEWGVPEYDDRALYEKLVELDVPAMHHGTSSKAERVSYSTHFINEETISVVSLVNSRVFQDFPKLKIVCSHGGGAVPYHAGRFLAPTLRRGGTSV